jgi:hypothetical protein
MTYSLTLRQEKGSLLTIQEMDGNFQYLDNKSVGSLTQTLALGNTFSDSILITGSGGGMFFGATSFSGSFITGFYSGYDFPGISGTGSCVFYGGSASEFTSLVRVGTYEQRDGLTMLVTDNHNHSSMIQLATSSLNLLSTSSLNLISENGAIAYQNQSEFYGFSWGNQILPGTSSVMIYSDNNYVGIISDGNLLGDYQIILSSKDNNNNQTGQIILGTGSLSIGNSNNSFFQVETVSGNIKISGYPNNRSDFSTSTNYLATDSSGKLLSIPFLSGYTGTFSSTSIITVTNGIITGVA